MKIRKYNESNVLLSEEEAEQLWGEIENQGFGYWVLEYGYKEDTDPKLKELSEKAEKAMTELKAYIDNIWSNYDIG